MNHDQEKLLKRAQDALVQLNHGACDDAAGVIHDLMKEVRQLQDKLERLDAPEVA
ncbi:hypothetical protein [Methylobacterium aquaticum]|uniref:Uncharacterized protein n=1 Tax=Methylobacterium aquaticum TaxID=270351 RepID=A0A0C6G2I7_9HYPH|nr:hypothetical protein [Methylobacterium aquaticum]BAQ50335.1 hypothetical protein Maq22A_3p50425 [Methylobacterium aquaticum]